MMSHLSSIALFQTVLKQSCRFEESQYIENNDISVKLQNTEKVSLEPLHPMKSF